MIINLTNPNGTKLLTGGKIVKEDITIIPNLPGGGTCDKPHVIEVDVLPTENIDENAVYLCGGRYYKYTSATLENVYVHILGSWIDYIELMVGVGLPPENASYNVIPTKTTDGVLESDGTNSFHVYYIEDEDNIFIYGEGQWFAIDEMPDTTVTNGGVITDISEATDTSKYYVVLSGGWKEWIPKEECGAELNIAYGDTAPEDTSKLWCKCDEPNKVIVSPNSGAEVATIADEETLEALSTMLPQKMCSIGTASVGKKIYLFGGRDGYTYYDTIYCFDTETNELNTLSVTLPGVLAQMGTASVGKKIYLFGGNNGSSITANLPKTIYCFDTEENTLSTLSTLPSHNYDMGVAVVDNKIYLFAGAQTDNIYCFDTETNTLNTVKALPFSVQYIGTASVGKKIYLFGGANGNTRYNTIYCFDTETNTLNTLSVTLPNPIAYHKVVSVGKKIYLFGGANGTTRYNTIYCFDTETNELNTLSVTLPIALYNISATAVGNKIYLFGGEQNGTTRTNKIYMFTASVDTISVSNGHLLIVALNKKNFFDLVASEMATITIGIDNVYKGNENNEGEEVEVALYKDGEWTTI